MTYRLKEQDGEKCRPMCDYYAQCKCGDAMWLVDKLDYDDPLWNFRRMYAVHSPVASSVEYRKTKADVEEYLDLVIPSHDCNIWCAMKRNEL